MKYPSFVGIGISAMIALSSCHTTEHVVVEKPAPVVVVKPSPVRGRTVFIEDEYRWRNGKYVAVPGHYVKPRHGKTWVAGHWDKREKGYIWVPGHWK